MLDCPLNLESLLVLAQAADFVGCLVSCCAKNSLPIDKVRRFLVGERSAVPGHRHTNIFVLRAGDTPLNALRAYDARCDIDANIYDPHGTRYAALVANRRDAALLDAARAVNPLLVGWWQRSGSTGVLLAQACGTRAPALDLVDPTIVAHPLSIFWWYAARGAETAFVERFPACTDVVASLRAALFDEPPPAAATNNEGTHRLCARCVAHLRNPPCGNVLASIERAVRDAHDDELDVFTVLTYAFLALRKRADVVPHIGLWRTCLNDSDTHYGPGDGRYVFSKRGRTVPTSHAELALALENPNNGGAPS